MFFKKRKISENILENIYQKFRIRRYIQLVIGIFIMAVTFNLFLYPNDIVFGGVSGLAIIANRLFNIEASMFIYASSSILLIVSYFALGKEKTLGSIVGSLLFPLFVQLTGNVGTYITIANSEVLLCALFGGVLYGFGAGLVFKAGFTSGGTDIINQIFSKYLHISMGNAMLISDGLIVILGAFVFGVNKLMYALIVIYIIGIMTDKVLLGISDSKAFYIITEKDDEVKDYILNYLGHGVTIFDTRGGFTKEKQKLLMCVVPTKEYFKLKEGIHEIDNKSFFVVTDAYEVSGGE